MDYGAAGNGTTDDITAINAAITAANAAGGNVVFSSMPHLITSPILMKSNVQLVLTNTLTASGMSTYGATEIDHSAVLFLGASVSTSALTVAGVAGDLTVTVASGSGFAVGDMVIVEDNYNFGRGNIDGVNSSLARVMNVATNVLTIDNPLPTAFPTATSLVRKVNLIQNASVTVATIAGAPYQGVTFQWARHCTVSNTEFNPIGKDAVYFHSAFGNLATNVIARNPQSVTSPFGYGCMFDFGASDNILSDSYFEGIREISVAEYGRRNIIKNNRIINPIDSGVNTHGLGATDTLIEGNIIIDAAQYSIAIGQVGPSGKAVDARTVVKNNIILTSIGYGIREVQYSSGTAIASDTVIEGNTIRFGSTDAIYIGGANVSTDVTNPMIINNKIISSGGNGITIDTVSCNNVVIQGNRIDSPATTGILLNASGTNINIGSNTVFNAGVYGIRNYAEGPRIIINGNIINTAGTANYLNIGVQAPLVGTWRQGDIMPNVGNISAGANIGWGCITASTSSTGTITTGTNALTLASASTFANGQGITVVGAGVAGANLNTTITSGGGTTSLVLAANASTSVAGAITTSAGTWKSMGTFAA
jgi:hypothetical protein